MRKINYNNNSKSPFWMWTCKEYFVIQSAVTSLEQIHPNNLAIVTDSGKFVFLEKQDLMLISLESWKSLLDSDSDWLIGVPSVLIIKP
jgi:hypothetical protein